MLAISESSLEFSAAILVSYMRVKQKLSFETMKQIRGNSYHIRRTSNEVQNSFQVEVSGTALILRKNLIIGYRKKIMPLLSFLMPENKKDCKIKRTPRHHVSQVTLN